MNLFERASREAFRFQSVRGELSTEQLWNLPLTSKTGFDLDSVAKAVNGELKGMIDESFVHKANPATDRQAAKLDVVKHIIAVKIAEESEARTAAARAIEKQKLLAILGEKKDSALKDLSAEELQARIDALK